MDITKEPNGHCNEAVSQTVLTVSIVHPSDIDPKSMSLTEIEGYTAMGQFVTQTQVASSKDIEDGQVDVTLEKIGAQPGHFAKPESLIERRTGRSGLEAAPVTESGE